MSRLAEEGSAPRPDKRRLALEIAALMSFLWLPSAWFGFHEYLAGLRQSEAWPAQVAEAIRAAGAIALVVYALLRSKEPLRRFGLSKITGGQVWAMVGLLAVVLAIHVLVLASRWVFDPVAWVRLGMPPHVGKIPAIPVLAIVLPLSALKEEVVMRGYLTTRFLDLWGSQWAAVLLSAVLFSLLHGYQGWTGPVSTFLVGIAYSLVLLRTRSIWPSVATHIGYNVLVRLGTVTAVVSWILHRALGL